MGVPLYLSLPSRERELKLIPADAFSFEIGVAPFAGARVETAINHALTALLPVAPFAGARVETSTYHAHV